MPKLEPYSKKLSYSYALGVFPSLMLLEARPDTALRLLLHPAGEENEGVAKLRQRCAELGVREEQAERVLKRESKKDNCFAGLVFEKYESTLDPNQCHAVLCQISDSGNVGTALRSLLGFGVRDVALIRPCVDVFDPRVVRASMGAMFQLHVRTYDSFAQYEAEHPGRTLYPFMLDGSRSLPDVLAGDVPGNWTLIFGNEGSGLPAEFSRMGQPVRIPSNDRVDSLNLSIAAAIGIYGFTQKK